MCCVRERWTRECLRKLEADGLIEIGTRRNERGDYQSNVYTFGDVKNPDLQLLPPFKKAKGGGVLKTPGVGHSEPQGGVLKTPGGVLKTPEVLVNKQEKLVKEERESDITNSLSARATPDGDSIERTQPVKRTHLEKHSPTASTPEKRNREQGSTAGTPSSTPPTQTQSARREVIPPKANDHKPVPDGKVAKADAEPRACVTGDSRTHGLPAPSFEPPSGEAMGWAVDEILALHPRHDEAVRTRTAVMEAIRSVCVRRELTFERGVAWLKERVLAYSACVEAWPESERRFIAGAYRWFRDKVYEQDPTVWGAQESNRDDVAAKASEALHDLVTLIRQFGAPMKPRTVMRDGKLTVEQPPELPERTKLALAALSGNMKAGLQRVASDDIKFLQRPWASAYERAIKGGE